MSYTSSLFCGFLFLTYFPLSSLLPPSTPFVTARGDIVAPEMADILSVPSVYNLKLFNCFTFISFLEIFLLYLIPKPGCLSVPEYADF